MFLPDGGFLRHGALTVPFAFLGLSYDPQLCAMYTELEPDDVPRSRGLMFGALAGERQHDSLAKGDSDEGDRRVSLRAHHLRGGGRSVTVRVCHCTDCQKLTGTGFRANITSLPETFRLKSGVPKIYIKTAESGYRRAHAFCPECGTPIYSTTRTQLAPPARQIWCRSALPWSMDFRVEKSDRQ